jgi:hypothetical protein
MGDRDGRNLLWLPPDYKPDCSAFLNNILALGHTSGPVTFLNLSHPDTSALFQYSCLDGHSFLRVNSFNIFSKERS